MTSSRDKRGTIEGGSSLPPSKLPDPYYADEAVVLYNCDCRTILPLLPKVDLVLTDPPYGIDFGKAGGFCASHGWGPWRENVAWDTERPSKDIFDLLLAAGTTQIIWGGNYFADYLPPSMGWLAWDKGQVNFSLADFELAWTSQKKAARRIVYARGRALQDGKQHPTQKPIAVMQWCINQVAKADTILDPFAGSGTTGVAAKNLGRKAILIEKEEKYAAIAAKRLKQGVLPF